MLGENVSTNGLTTPFSAARLSLIAGTATVILLGVLHALSPEFDPARRMVSEYALGRHGWVLSLMFLVWALSCVSLFFALKPQISTMSGKIGLGFLLAAAVGMTMAAFFDIRHSLHGLAAMIGNPSFLLASALISKSLLHRPEWQSARQPLLWMAVLAWVSFVLMMVIMFAGPASGGGEPSPGMLIGWPNRLLVIAACAWVMVAAWQPAQVGAATTG